MIEPLVPKARERAGETLLNRRELLNAMLYVDRTGCQWQYLPHDFPNHKTVYSYFTQWRDDGTFEKSAVVLRRKLRVLEGCTEEPTLGIFDSQSRQTTEAGGEKGVDAAKRVKGRKRHILVDILGCILAVFVTAASVQVRDMILPLLKEVRWTVPSVQKMLFDQGY